MFPGISDTFPVLQSDVLVKVFRVHTERIESRSAVFRDCLQYCHAELFKYVLLANGADAAVSKSYRWTTHREAASQMDM